MPDNVYYNTEKFPELRTIGSLEADISYEFNILVVFRSTTTDNVYYWASDMGCSCPTPFDDFTSIDSLNKGTKHDACVAVEQFASEEKTVTDMEKTQLIELIIKAA